MIDVARRLNALTLPSCLPVGILARIFALGDPWQYCDPLVNRYHNKYEYSDNTKMLPFAQVSHHWRQVALDTPQLWCHIRMHKKPAYNEMLLDRSKDCSLYVEGFPRWIDASRILPLFRALPRACYLHATLPSECKLSFDDILSICPDRDNLVAPRLMTFIEGRSRSRRPSSEQPSVLSALRITPNLRYATVMPAHTSFHYLHSRPLVNLTIMSFHVISDELPPTARSLEHVATLLSTTPSLEVLNLDLCEDYARLPTSPARVSLPRLKQLVVHGDLMVVESLVRRLDTPASTRTVGRLNLELDINDVDVPEMADAVLHMIQRAAGSMPTVELEILGKETTIRCWLMERPDNFAHRRSCIHANDQGCFDVHLGYRWDTITKILLHSPALSAVFHYLHIGSVGRVYRTITTGPYRALQQLNNVEELECTGISVLRIADLLGGDNGAVPCTKLRVLRLTECSEGCGGGRHAVDHDDGEEDGVPMGHSGCRLCQSPAVFLSVLKQRSSAGIPVQRLVITESTYGRGWLVDEALHWRDTMRSVVSDVSVQIHDSPSDTSFLY